MTERMYIQVIRQIVFLDDKFEAPCECCRRHRLVQLMLSEQKVVVGYSSPLIVQPRSRCSGGTLSAAFPSQVRSTLASACFGFRLLDADILTADLDYIAADMHAAPGVVNVAPLYAATLAAPYPCCDDELEVSLALDAFFLQRADQLLHYLFVGNDLLLFYRYLNTCRCAKRVVINKPLSTASLSIPHRHAWTPSTVSSESGLPFIIFFFLCAGRRRVFGSAPDAAP